MPSPIPHATGTAQIVALLLPLFAAGAGGQPYPDPAGWWEFDVPVDPTLATLGQALTSNGKGFQVVPGIAGDDGAVEVKPGSYYRMNHGIAAGTGGGTKINEFTLLLDVSYPQADWKALYQSNVANTTDATMFITPSNRISSVFTGSSAPLTSINTWYRLVVTVDNGTARRVYLNGQKVGEGAAGALDDLAAVSEAILLFTDNDGEDGPIRVSNAAIWGSALDATQVAALGGPGDFVCGAVLNHPPAITEGATVSQCVSTATPAPLTIHAVDQDADELAWSLSVPPGHGSVQITASSNTGCTVTYTSEAGYTGTDTFSLTTSDGRLSATTAVHLVVRNDAPVIAGGGSYLLAATRDGGPFEASFSATDANGDSLAWAIAAAPTHGTVQLTPGAAGACTIAYTPASGHAGADEFILRVSDGLAAAEVRVTAITSIPSGDPVLAVFSAHGTTDPPPGNLILAAGTPVTLSATDEIGPDVRHICTGWTLQGAEPGSGFDRTLELTLVHSVALTWQWRTDYRIRTAVSGSGSISGATTWQNAGRPLQLTATPASGHHFVGWSGDTAGCTMGGPCLVLPMDRPYDTITANFAADENFTVVALPDTQKYTLETATPNTFSVQTQWVVDHLVSHNIKYVTHEGDLVETPTSSSQWEIATAAMNLLNGQVPYGVVMGNHDYQNASTPLMDRFGPNPSHPSSVGRWIDPATGQSYTWIGDNSPDGIGDYSPSGYSTFRTFKFSGRDFLFLHLDINTPNSDMTWAAGVLRDHPRHLTMITTHNYLAANGGALDGSGTGEPGFTARVGVPVEADRNSPEVLFETLVKPFNQVFMVICGHNYAAYYLPATNGAGRTVHQVLCNYQTLVNGGNGFLRLMEFQPSQRRIHNTTYSPKLGRFYDPNRPEDHAGMQEFHDPNGGEFTLDFEFEDRFDTALQVFNGGPGNGGPTTLTVPASCPLVSRAEAYVDGLTRYRPTGWALSKGQQAAGLGDTAVFVMQQDSQLTWSWAEDYWLDTAIAGDGVVNIGDGWQAAGSILTLVAQPDPGSSFLGWSGDLEGCTANGAVLTVPMSRPRGPVTASFAPHMHTLTVVTAAESAQPPAGSLALPHGTLTNFSAVPQVSGRYRLVPTGWTITGDQPASGTGSSGSYILSGDATLTWNWVPEVYLEVASGLEGIVLPMDAAGWKPLGATVNLVAGAAPQFEFVGWNGAVPANSTLPQLSLVMDTPRMIGADFKPQLTAAGTPHWWLDTHARVSGGDYEAAEAGDADGDGQSAREEFLAGMSDRDPKRRFQVSQLARDGARGEVLLTWTACAGRNYSVSRSHDLALPFMPLGSPVAGVSPAMSAVFPAAERRNFYRVETTLAPGGPLDPDPPALSPQSQPGVIGRAMRRVPTGWFTRGTDLGDANAKPAHAVWVAGFEIDRFEVTRADWEAVAAWAAAHDYDIPLTPGFVTPPDHPATGISWYQAVKWCNARSEMDGRVPAYYTDTGGFTVFRRGEPDLTAAHVNWAGNGYRLPTEAEWERASRGGMEGFPYPWGDAPAETRANHWDYSLQTGRAPTGVRPYTLPAGSFATAQQPNSDDANAYDLHDMVGNVREWTWDRMASYGPDPQLAPRGPDAGSDRVLRGGSWLESMTHTTNVQRNPIPPDRADIAGTNGFRCVRGLHPNE